MGFSLVYGSRCETLGKQQYVLYAYDLENIWQNLILKKGTAKSNYHTTYQLVDMGKATSPILSETMVYVEKLSLHGCSGFLEWQRMS
jgi:hypothetical protein